MSDLINIDKKIEFIKRFVTSKGKLVTNSKIYIRIIKGVPKYTMQMYPHVAISNNKLFFELRIPRFIIREYTINQLKTMIFHELAHIPNQQYKFDTGKQIESHGKEFKSTCNKLGAPKDAQEAILHIKNPTSKYYLKPCKERTILEKRHTKTQLNRRN